MMLLEMFKRSAIAVSLIGAIGAPAFAGDSGSSAMVGASPSPLVVKSNGSSYTQLSSASQVTLTGQLIFDTGTAGRVKSWSVWPVVYKGFGPAQQVPGMSGYKVNKSYAIGHRPKTVHWTPKFNIPAGKFEAAAVEMCNMQASVLRSQGKSDAQIFGVNRQVSFKLGMMAKVDSTGAGSNNQVWEASPAHVFKVRCEKFKGARIPTAGGGFKAPLKVEAATMKLSEIATLGGACKVKTVTAIRTSEAGATLKYRFVHSSGKKSGVFSTKTAGNKIAVVTHTWDVPNKPGPEKGWLRLDIVSPMKFSTAREGYKMVCKSKAPGGLAPKPTRPTGPTVERN